MTTYSRWQRRLMRRSLNIRTVFTARRTGRGLMKSGERSGAVKWKHSHPPDELTIIIMWFGDYLNNVLALIFPWKNRLIYLQYLHTFVAHWIMFCLHCSGVMRNMKAREMLNYLHHLEFKFPANLLLDTFTVALSGTGLDDEVIMTDKMCLSSSS